MLNAPLLQLDAARMHEIDPRNVESLFGMWTVFSRCAATIPDGKRLENMSWRVWARETLCCPPQPERTIVPAIHVVTAGSSPVPSLSNSVASEDSADEAKEFPFSSRNERNPRESCAENSALSISRGKETHLTPLALEKIVTTIQEKSELTPLSPSIEEALNSKLLPDIMELKGRSSDLSSTSQPFQCSTESSCISEVTADTLSTERQSEHRNSDTSVSSDGIIRTGSVVHGFSPASASLRSRSKLCHALPVVASKNIAKTLVPQRQGMFTLGGSSEDDDSSFEQHMSFKHVLPEHRKSSLSQCLRDSPQKKTTSFRDIVEQRRIQEGSENDEGAIASSDEEDDDIEDSAIEEDDEAEWEDSNSDDEKPLTDHVFQRIDSRPNLVSRRSVLTAGLTEADRANGLMNAASRSSPAIRQSRATSHTGPSMPVSPDDNEDDGAIMMQAPQGTRPMPIIPPTSGMYSMAHSPRTTRRNMLSTELTESLRKNLLWERQQKNTTVNAFLKREAKSMANLQKHATSQAISKPTPLSKETSANHSWNHYFDNPWEYHNKGW